MSALPFSLRPLWIALSMAIVLPAAWANDDHAPAKPAPKAEKAEKAAEKAAPRAEAKADAKSEAREEPRAAKTAPPVPDPMNRLRERLAEKLGNQKAAEPVEANTLRVVSTASPSAAAQSDRPLASDHRVAMATPRPSAGYSGLARLAAERRAALNPHGRELTPTTGAVPHAAHWGYAGAEGPEAWGSMKPENAACSSGARQSPIDIRDGIKVQLDPVRFEYQPSTFSVIDNGHTVQVNVAPGNSIEVLGKRYDLVQFHFHRPSEERINGRQFDMVAHLVHKDLDNHLAVIAVLLERGGSHPIIQTVWNNLPLEKNDAVPARVLLDMNALLPNERNYFTYMGSLTTPPCSEGVLWMVMKQPVAVSADQIGIFSRLYPMNARPIQSAAGRLIKESN